MIETNMQQQDIISQQPSHPQPEAQTAAGKGLTVICSICEATYAPSPQQAPFLQYAQGALEATFMGMCHFCFRCRRAACPQCWDEVHGVCGECVQEAGLPFRVAATPLEGLMFPPTARASIMPSQPQSNFPLVLVRNGRFYNETQVKQEPTPTDLTTEHTPAIQLATAQTGMPDAQIADVHHHNESIEINKAAMKTGENYATEKAQIDTPAAVAIPIKTPAGEDSQETRQEEAPRATKKVKKVSRLELVLTWIVLAIVVALVVVIVLAEVIPVVNVAIAHTTNIDIHAEIAYLVRIVQQLFKR